MATNTQSGNGALWFIVGALVVAVIGFGVWYFTGQPSATGEQDSDIAVSISEDGMTVDTREE
ncbi:MAG: hypothetical protein VX593_10195 [Pseudomonadota bacterium]|jgi:hypothetical protein|nr:hypothetical protein [Pseudomonadota bacterium]